MKTNKEIVTEIIEDLENTVGLNWPATRTKITRDKLIACWFGHIIDWKFYGYVHRKSVSASYKNIFKNINSCKKGKAEPWKSYIFRKYDYKQCSRCYNILEFNEFNNCKKEISGLANECRACYALVYVKNKDTILEKNREYRHNNIDKVNSYSAKRRASKLQRTPSWFSNEDDQKIKDLYTQAKNLEKLHGVKYHVDHIIPLQGKLVSGLHISSNLQIITAKDNLSKGNTYSI